MAMYRQILMDPVDRQYQLIFWRYPGEPEIKIYELNTVTFGTSSAPFQAQRVILQLIKDEGQNYPLAISVLENDRYVDDVMSGDEEIDQAIEKRNQVTQCLQTAGLVLRKWASNSFEIIKDVNPENHGLALDKPFDVEGEIKILGLKWKPLLDSFEFHTNVPENSEPTKRNILSLIARLYDPLGWLSPVIVIPKILIQELWKLSIDWDERVPDHISNKWKLFYEQLKYLNDVKIPRWTGYKKSANSIDLHGYCDASEQAYSAVIYLVLETEIKERKVSLIFAKTKVAPVKKLTIPKLELNAAWLLTRSLLYVIESLKIQINNVNCWCDSTIVLHWLKKSPSELKVFVSNRVAFIQNKLPQATCRHVPSFENPADCASRGVFPANLKHHNLWWTGPEWLIQDTNSWPNQNFLSNEPITLEVKQAHIAQIQPTVTTLTLPNDVSSWLKLIRVTAFAFRFIQRCRFPDVTHLKNFLHVEELKNAQLFWIKQVQNEFFFKELSALKNKTRLPMSSSLLSLDIFLDESGLIRVGGRLHRSEMPSEQRHPILLPKCRISELLVLYMHLKTYHGGIQLTLRVLRERFWILKVRNLVRKIIHSCVTCVRVKAKTEEQFMANLPSVRIQISRPFSHCGVDYAGPIQVRNSSGRGHKSHKAYISLFVCLSTRAIHLELVHDYSTAAFIAALERFCARRGLPTCMYSDNGTTFQGAERELREAFKTVTNDPKLRDHFASDQINWQFLPPSAPHYGGIWEAGVKSVKHHLKRTLISSTPTGEELTTLLCNVEACLNSRPIAPLKDDVSSFDALTPGHFLIGSALKSIPMPSVLDVNENRLNRWKSLQQKYEQFWNIWSKDYLHSLQQRSKWRFRKPNLEKGNLVLLKNALLPPTKWELGRIIECFPDNENIVRTVRVQTARSIYIRPITQLVKLPICDSNK